MSKIHIGKHRLKKLYGPFLWMGFNCLKAKATLKRLFSSYHYISFQKFLSTLDPPSGFEHGSPGLGIQCFNHTTFIT